MGKENTMKVSGEAASIARDALVSYIERKLPKDKKEQIIAMVEASALLGSCTINALVAGGAEKDEAMNVYITILKNNIEILEEHGKEL